MDEAQRSSASDCESDTTGGDSRGAEVEARGSSSVDVGSSLFVSRMDVGRKRMARPPRSVSPRPRMDDEANMHCIHTNQEICAVGSSEEIAAICGEHTTEFNLVSFVTALHRIAKHGQASVTSQSIALLS